ncbi:uncharacterized protein LOC123024220 [Varanus komodoensis]|uniref:uncharacterized protein LOC123024220 n=1 Tax=Varanus komodoensis TaxID=61221 RepID=UPI001CF79109|nr:uncharacterized protein LOC123024220 [Varanus komodoensis]
MPELTRLACAIPRLLAGPFTYHPVATLGTQGKNEIISEVAPSTVERESETAPCFPAYSSPSGEAHGIRAQTGMPKLLPQLVWHGPEGIRSLMQRETLGEFWILNQSSSYKKGMDVLSEGTLGQSWTAARGYCKGCSAEHNHVPCCMQSYDGGCSIPGGSELRFTMCQRIGETPRCCYGNSSYTHGTSYPGMHPLFSLGKVAFFLSLLQNLYVAPQYCRTTLTLTSSCQFHKQSRKFLVSRTPLRGALVIPPVKVYGTFPPVVALQSFTQESRRFLYVCVRVNYKPRQKRPPCF